MRPWDSAPDDSEVYRPALIRGRYRVTRVLHRGRQGDVVVAADNREGQDVVLKRVFEPSPDHITRLRTVHRVLSGLGHPGVMGTRELVEARSDAWLVCERVAGSGLLDWWNALPLDARSSFDERWRSAALVVSGLIDALEALHTRQVAHLDLKPQNVLVGRAGDVHLVDLGLGTVPGGIDTRPMAEIRERSGYLAPEHARSGIATRRSDQWSLGALTYEMITGEKAVPGTTPSEFDRSYGLGRARPIREWLPSAPDTVVRTIERLLDWDPERRFATMAEVRASFGDLLTRSISPPIQVWSSTRPPVVGRESLDTFFRRRLLDLRNRKGCLIRVVDEAGAGKTRLLHRWAKQASQDRRIQVLEASCQPSWPRTVLHRWFRPPIQDTLGPPPKDLVERAMERFDQPTVLLLDSLEEADTPTWARVQRAAGVAADGWAPKPIIVVLAGRALGGLSSFVQQGSETLFNVALPPLRAEHAAAMLRPFEETPEARDALEKVVADALETSGGNPQRLVLEFLSREMAGTLRRDGRLWIAGGPPVGGAETFPSEGSAQVLSYVAKLGQWVEVELVLACLPLPVREILGSLCAAAAAGRIEFREFGGRWYLNLLDTDLPSIDLPDLRATHARAAQWLERNGEFGGLAAERTAQYWHQAAESGRAADAYSRASLAHGAIGSASHARRLVTLSRAFDGMRAGQTTPGTNPYARRPRRPSWADED